VKTIHRLPIVLAAILAAGQHVTAEVPTRDIDLASKVTLDLEVTPEVPFRIRVTNLMPSKMYRVRTTYRTVLIRPLPDVVRFQTTELKGNDPCPELAAAAKGVGAAADEAAVSAAANRVRTFLDAGGCADAEVVDAARDTLNATVYDNLPDQFAVPGGRELEVIVERVEGTTVQRTWTSLFRTAMPGAWGALSTLAFVPTQDDEYFMKQEAADSFVITRKADRRTADIVPAVLFTWAPAGRENSPRLWSIAGGLGFDSSNPLVMLGASVTFYRNLGITAGLVGHRQRRLVGNYEVGQKIKENLTAEQLHQNTYAPNLFVGVHYRFGSTKNLTKE
jgi:hypothetical protein